MSSFPVILIKNDKALSSKFDNFISLIEAVLDFFSGNFLKDDENCR